MRRVLVTGSEGFLGRNLCQALVRREGVEVLRFDVQNTLEELEVAISQADFICHLAGVNRPIDEKEFTQGNTDLTRTLCELASKLGRQAPIFLSSSTQAESDNPYGISKRLAEEALIAHGCRNGTPVLIYRFPNLFGKWSRPNYNSVVSTFCYNVTHDLPLQVNDPLRCATFAYVDDVVETILGHVDAMDSLDVHQVRYELSETYTLSLGRLSELVLAFKSIRQGGLLPDLSDPFVRKLYSTFLFYYEPNALAYPVKMNTDNRGWLFELIRSKHFGQIFVSQTHPGVTRGNHGHDTKVEKFCVIQGSGIIRLRRLETDVVHTYEVSGENVRIVDIPPGYTHSIENTGTADMITLFWANEVFDSSRPDTCFEEVLPKR